MKLSEWAKKQGVSYRTAWRWFKAGILPVPVKQLSNGTIILSETEEKPLVVAIYARVSSSDQKKDLDSQVAKLVTFANEKGLSVAKTVTEIGSGLNSTLQLFSPTA
jgi:putative resolvase